MLLLPPEAKVNLDVQKDLPGSEVPQIKAKTPEEIKKLAETLYPPLPPLPEEPKFVPRPEGPYTLSELQTIAALNSPTLKQAASDVKAAEGALGSSARLFQSHCRLTWQPSNDGSTAGWQGVNLSQSISIAGKMDLAVASAKQDLKNAELALKKARSDLSTQVRTAYFGLLVAKETDRVNRALAVLTDEVYITQVKLLKAGQAASYEPSTLLAQAHSARLALQQGITNYDFAWKQVVSAIGLRQLPLSEVAGRVDSFIPYFDYDRVLAHVLQNHTDVLTVRNGIDKAKYQLKLAQVQPYSDVAFPAIRSVKKRPWRRSNGALQAVCKLRAYLGPKQRQHHVRRSGARAGSRATARDRIDDFTTIFRTPTTITRTLSWGSNSIAATFFPIRFVTIADVLDRRNLDGNVQFGDLVQAQQTLASNVSSYLTILSQIWTASVTVADFLQTDDLFQLAKPEAVPALPDMSQLPPLPDCHQSQVGPATGSCPPVVGEGWLPAGEAKP